MKKDYYQALGLEEGLHQGAFRVGVNYEKTKLLLDVYPKHLYDTRTGLTKKEVVILINYLLENLLELT